MEPLWQHVFPPAAAPTLAFLGMCWETLPFLEMELQAKLVARCLSGRARLPPRAAMERDVAAHFRALAEAGIDERCALQKGGCVPG